jgi:hypothetical protein
VSVDAKRGQVFLITGTQAIDLSGFGSGLNRFFTDHLAFEILRYFPNVPTDNHFNGVGLHGVYDSKYDRVIITKLDYIPLSNDVKYDVALNEFYVETQYRMPSEDLFYSVVRETVSLKDPKYFCNKSWTVSFNFNTKTWISFHSYLPNWYVGENNFFYSGINGCCDDFDFIVGEPAPVPTTTTTSSTSSTSTTSTTTTTTTLNCNLDGEVEITECELEGTAVITSEPCFRPEGLIEEPFFTGYNVVSPIINVNSTGSLVEACDAIAYLNTFGGVYVGVTPLYTIVDYQGLYIGSQVFFHNGTNDCTTIPDGWYFTEESQADDTAFHVVGGVIVDIDICIPPTTTTTSTSSTTTTTTTTTILCEDYYNNTSGDFTGINYTACDGTPYTNQTVGAGQSICVQPGTLSGGDSGFLILLGNC